MLTLDELILAWEVTIYAVYKAVRDGQLRRKRRPGYQAYYAYSDVVAWLKSEPKHPIPPSSVKTRAGVKGPQLSFAELESAA